MTSKELIEANAALVEAMDLTEDEFKAAITEGKRKKFFKLKHGHLWNALTETVDRLKTKS